MSQVVKRVCDLCGHEITENLDTGNINFNYDADNIAFCIHIDCGVNGPSGAVIPEVVGYVHSMGYECQVKPDSPIASCIADRISK